MLSKKFTCACCSYETEREDHLERHKTSLKHLRKMQQYKTNLLEENLDIPTVQSNQSLKTQETNQILETVLHKIQSMENQNLLTQNILLNQIVHLQTVNIQNQHQLKQYQEDQDFNHEAGSFDSRCRKCFKCYKSEKLLNQHEAKCKIFNDKTCPVCKKTFANKSVRRHHQKQISCKIGSIAKFLQWRDAHNPDLPVSFDGNRLKPIFVNDFGKERKDFIDYEGIFQIVTRSAMEAIPNYVSHKHFNPEYPENNNMKCENKQCYIKVSDRWDKIHNTNLMNKLYNIGGSELLYYVDTMYKNEFKLDPRITDEKWVDIQEVFDFGLLEKNGIDKMIKRTIVSRIANNSDHINDRQD